MKNLNVIVVAGMCLLFGLEALIGIGCATSKKDIRSNLTKPQYFNNSQINNSITRKDVLEAIDAVKKEYPKNSEYNLMLSSEIYIDYIEALNKYYNPNKNIIVIPSYEGLKKLPIEFGKREMIIDGERKEIKVNEIKKYFNLEITE